MIDLDVILWIFIASMVGQLVALVVLALIANWMIKRTIKQAAGNFLGALEGTDKEKLDIGLDSEGE